MKGRIVNILTISSINFEFPCNEKFKNKEPRTIVFLKTNFIQILKHLF